MQKDSLYAGGALAGGVLGALIAGPQRRGLKIATSAAVGAAVQGAAAGGTLQLYTVSLLTRHHLRTMSVAPPIVNWQKPNWSTRRETMQSKRRFEKSVPFARISQ